MLVERGSTIRSRRWVPAAVAAAALVLTGTVVGAAPHSAPASSPPAGEPVYGGTLTVSGESEVANAWTPGAMQCDQFCYVRARTFYDQLAVLDDNGDPQPMLAESITPNDDFSEWTVTMREGVMFTDGTPVNAEAVIYNLQVAGAGLLLGAGLSDVAKIPDPDDPSRTIMKIEQLDDLTFTVYLGKDGDPEQPRTWPRFPTAFATQWGMIASQQWLEAVAEDPSLAAQPVGSGPFMVESYAPGESLEVVRNPDYWLTDAAGNQYPYLDGMTFRVIEDSAVASDALQSGDIDVVTTSAARTIVDYIDNPEFTLNLQEDYGDTNYLLVNLDTPGALQDQRVRCALSMAIDRQEIIDATAAGILEPANGVFSPGQQGYLDDNGFSIEQDLDGAAALIEEYESETGEDVVINLSHTPPNNVVQTAELLLGYWSEIGVDVETQTVPQNDLITLALFGDPSFQVAIWRNHAGTAVSDQYFWWHSVNAAPVGQLGLNFGRIRDPEIDEALETARGATNPQDAQAAAEAINRRFAEQCYQIPLSWTKWGIITATDVMGYGDLRLPGLDVPLRQYTGQLWTHSLWRSSEG